MSEFVNWRKARASTDGGGCVEVCTDVDGVYAVRDSKLGDVSPILTFNDREWAAFKDGVTNDEF